MCEWRREDLVEVDGLGIHVDLAGEEADRLGQTADRIDVDPFDDSGLGGVGAGTSTPSRLSLAACSTIERIPLTGRVSPVRASSPTIAKLPGRSRATWPLATSKPERDRQVEARPHLS